MYKKYKEKGKVIHFGFLWLSTTLIGLQITLRQGFPGFLCCCFFTRFL